MFAVRRSVATIVIGASVGWSSRSFLRSDAAHEAGHGQGGGDADQQGVVAGTTERGCSSTGAYGYWDLRARLPKGEEASISFECTVTFTSKGQTSSCSNKRSAVASVVGQGGAVWVQAATLPIEVTGKGQRNWNCTVEVQSQNGIVTEPGSKEIGTIKMGQTEVTFPSVGSTSKIEVYGFMYRAGPKKQDRSWFWLQDLPNMTCGMESYWYTGHWDVQMLVPAETRAHVRFDCDLISYSGCHYKRWAETVFIGKGDTWVKAATIPMSVPQKNWATWICTAWAVTGGLSDDHIGSEISREELGEVYYNMGTDRVRNNSLHIGGAFTFWAKFKTTTPGR